MIEKESKVLITCETKGFDEATDKVEALAEAYDSFPPQVQIKNCRDCTIYVYPSQTKIYTEPDTSEADSAYEDGYDDGCMDMTDDDIGSDIEEGVWEK